MKNIFTVNEIEDMGLVRFKARNNFLTDTWTLAIGEYDVYFHYDQQNRILSCRCSDGGDYSIIYDELTVEKFEELSKTLK